MISNIISELNALLNYLRRVILWKYNYLKIKITVPSITPKKIIDLGNKGGNNILLDDIDNDGNIEIIVLQSFGMWKSKLYRGSEFDVFQSNFTQKKLFSLTCMTLDQEIKWEVGERWHHDKPYLCHGHEESIRLADINDDGKKEIITFNENGFLVVYNCYGALLHEIELPNDNFSIVYYISTSNGNRFIIGTMDRSYLQDDYANPWIFMDDKFQIISEASYIGAGHNIGIADFNNDGLPEFLIGYQLVDLNGRIIWTLDEWQSNKIISLEQHADCIQPFNYQNSWYAAIAGSDYQYLIDNTGKTLWKVKLPHPQYCVVGKVEEVPVIIVDNQRQGTYIYSFNGEKIGQIVTTQFYNTFLNTTFIDSKRPIHQSLPIQMINNHYCIYFESGSPYILNFRGEVKAVVTFDSRYFCLHNNKLFRRINDLGLTFGLVRAKNVLAMANRRIILII